MTVPERYTRNLSALSEADCAALGSAHVAVAGCGGLGGYVIESLARIGVGHLRVIDDDAFEESNLNRQLLSTEGNVGTPKVNAARTRVAAVNSAVEIDALRASLAEDNATELVAGSDCVVDCLDNLQARFWLAHAAGELGVPVVYGAIAGWFGQACAVFPGDVSFATVYGQIEGTSAHEELGNLPSTASVVAAVQSAETVKVLTGRGEPLRNRLLMVDLLSGTFDEVELAERKAR